MLTTVLEILGIACLAAFAYAVWEPAAFGVTGVACLVLSWRIERGSGK